MKYIIKKAMLIICFIICSPLIIVAQLEKIITKDKGEEIFRLIGQVLCLIPGKIGSYMRVAYYKGSLDSASVDFHMDFGSYFSHRKVVVGSNVNIGAYAIIGCASIENDVMIASRVSIVSGKNTHKDASGKVSREEHNYNVVRIGARSWIGEGAIVMDEIGADCIVSAGSVVTKKSPDNIIAIGNPARFLSDYKK